MRNFEITKREVLASISIIAVMILVGILISAKITERQMDRNEVYNKAVKIDNQEMFSYGMRTNLCRVLCCCYEASLWLHFSGKEGLGKNEKGDFQISTIYIGERQSGKTTMLIEMSEKTGATIVVATYPMAKYIQLLAAQMGKKIPVPITVTNYIRLLASGGLGKSEKYLVDELQMMLSAMNVEAATVDCDCIEILRGQQKEGL